MESSRKSQSPKPKPDLKLNARSSLRCKSSLASPLASPLSSPVAPSTSTEINVDSLVAHEVEANSGPEDPSRKKKVKANCPCISSSQGQAWLLVCTDCKQSWHNTCANLKGTITKPVVDSIQKSWQCPWCWNCPFPRPSKHKQAKNDQSLISESLAAKISLDVSQLLSSSIKDLLENKPKEISTIHQKFEEQLEKLTSDIINEFNQTNQSMAAELKKMSEVMKNRPAPISTSITQKPSNIESIKHQSNAVENLESIPTAFEEYKKDFLSAEAANDLQAFLEQESYSKEGSREVAFYGQKYQYMGSKKNPKLIPTAFKSLLDSLNTNLDYKLNQVLLNRYTGPDASLPSHSDDENDINPTSSIFTVSIGNSATVTFTNIKSGEESELIVEDRSLYRMTKDSQNEFKHQIRQYPDNSVRYSLTFRCTHWSFLNSTYAVGDSNFGCIRFGEGRGNVGAATPGLKDWSAKVDDIIP